MSIKERNVGDDCRYVASTSLADWRPLLVGLRPLLLIRLEAIASRSAFSLGHPWQGKEKSSGEIAAPSYPGVEDPKLFGGRIVPIHRKWQNELSELLEPQKPVFRLA